MINALSKAVRGARRFGTTFPPLVALRRELYRRRFAAGLPGCVWGIFPTLDEAARAAPPARKLGYDHPDTASLYQERHERIYPADYPVLFWLERILTEPAHLFDFGGHVGIQYYSYRRHLTHRPGLRWTVCDVPEVCRAGERLAAERGATGLGFTTAFGDAEGASVLLAAGSLQYLGHDYLSAALPRLKRPPEHVVVNKLPVHPTHAFATLQDIGPACQPYAVFAREPFVAGVTAAGYELVDAWENAELSCRIPWEPKHDVPAYSGFYFRRR